MPGFQAEYINPTGPFHSPPPWIWRRRTQRIIFLSRRRPSVRRLIHPRRRLSFVMAKGKKRRQAGAARGAAKAKAPVEVSEKQEVEDMFQHLEYNKHMAKAKSKKVTKECKGRIINESKDLAAELEERVAATNSKRKIWKPKD